MNLNNMISKLTKDKKLKNHTATITLTTKQQQLEEKDVSLL